MGSTSMVEEEAAPAAAGPGRPRCLLVTACNSAYMHLLRGCLESFQSFPGSSGVDSVCFDVGLEEEDRRWLEARAVRLAEPRTHFGIDPDAFDRTQLAFLTRPFLREYFPGYDVYLWIDSDVWLQRWSVIDSYIEGALVSGMAIAHERERGYRFQAWLFGWMAKHLLLGFGPVEGAYLLSRPSLNAGMFAIHTEAPHWAAWAEHYRAAIERSGKISPHDQFALNRAIHGGPLSRPAFPTAVLPANANWICDRGVPMWNDAEKAFCEPYPPFRPIGALHLAGPAKRTEYAIRRTGGGAFTARLLFGTRPPAS
jgi:hypothetical protein